MKDFKNLLVWEKAHILTKDIYCITVGFPKEEIFGLTSQLKRAAVSVPTNIAEEVAMQILKDLFRLVLLQRAK